MKMVVDVGMYPERVLCSCVSLPDSVQYNAGGVGAVQERRLQICEQIMMINSRVDIKKQLV